MTMNLSRIFTTSSRFVIDIYSFIIYSVLLWDLCKLNLKTSNYIGNQADCVDRNIWCWEDIYKGSCGGHGILQWGSSLFPLTFSFLNSKTRSYLRLTRVSILCRNRWSLLSRILHHNRSVQLKKLIHGARYSPSPAKQLASFMFADHIIPRNHHVLKTYPFKPAGPGDLC